MKEFNLLIWLTQLGLSVALPLIGFVFLALWLHKSCGWGEWVIWAGLALGILSAVSSFRSSLQIMMRIAQNRKKEPPPPVSFNDHI